MATVQRSLELHISASEQIIKQRGGRDIRKRIGAEHNLLHVGLLLTKYYFCSP